MSATCPPPLDGASQCPHIGSVRVLQITARIALLLTIAATVARCSGTDHDARWDAAVIHGGILAARHMPAHEPARPRSAMVLWDRA